MNTDRSAPIKEMRLRGLGVGLRRSGHGMPCPYGCCGDVEILASWGAASSAPTVAARRSGRGVPCPYGNCGDVEILASCGAIHKQRPCLAVRADRYLLGFILLGGDVGWSRARASATNLAKRWARVKMRSDWRRRMASLGISSPPMPRAEAPARMKFAAVC